MRFGSAVVVGKFYPPHRGHKLLIDAALAQARDVTVVVCAKATDAIPGELRAQWLQEIHPSARVIAIDDSEDVQDPRVWAANTIAWLGRVPAAVFTSEDYGEPYARALGCEHVLVDRHRMTVPCSATAIRRDPYAHWHCLEPPVRAWYALRVCVLGAASTGTTTLARALARHYETVCVAEYGREYSTAKQARGETQWSSDEFVHIANEQNAREERAAREANRVVVCDTNAFATAFWHRRYVGAKEERVRAATSNVRCDLYLLTGDEIPFERDGLRDSEAIRHEMHQWFEEALRAQPVPWLLLRGSPDARMAEAVAAIDALLQGGRA